nr:MAG: hypothetical protein [Microviridae sp.]
MAYRRSNVSKYGHTKKRYTKGRSFLRSMRRRKP